MPQEKVTEFSEGTGIGVISTLARVTGCVQISGLTVGYDQLAWGLIMSEVSLPPKNSCTYLTFTVPASIFSVCGHCI